MKQLFYAFAVIAPALIFSSCKEHSNLGVILTDKGQALSDTTYTAAVEAVSARKVIVEEFTGASCSNCPAARLTLASIVDQNPGRVLPLELHPTSPKQGLPIPDLSKYNFNVQEVMDIISQYFPGLTEIPTAGINRAVYKNNTIIYKGDWASVIGSQLAVEPAMNLKLTNNYDAAKREGVIRVKVAYTKDVTNKQYLSVCLIENNIVDAQEYPTDIDMNYTFKHVFRKIFTPVGGTAFLDTMSVRKAGRVYEGDFKYTIDPSWNPDNCQLVVYVHNNQADSKEILQAEEINVK